MPELIVILLVISIIAGMYMYFIYQRDTKDLENKLLSCKTLCPNYNNNNSNINKEKFSKINHPLAQQQPMVMSSSSTSTYDAKNYSDPLVYPTSRPPSHVFEMVANNALFHNPTRGYPDSPSYIGNLIEENLVGNDDDLKMFNMDVKDTTINSQIPSVLQLMGLQKYPGSSKFDYYVLLPSTGNSPPIKYVIDNNKNEEIYDGDHVKILGKKYIVKKNKSPFEYLPNF